MSSSRVDLKSVIVADDCSSEEEESSCEKRSTEETLLFYMVLVIELNELGPQKNEPFIAYRLPNLWQKDPYSNNVASFCFPDTTPFPTTEMENERFSFVLTEDDGDRRFGYCLRKLAQGTGARMPICFVVLTYIPCEPLYNKILDRIAYHYESSSSQILTHFLESVIQNDFPQPGGTFSVEIHDKHLPGGSDRWTLTRPETDLSIEQLPVDRVLVSISSLNILRIFTSLLIERRIIFCSKKISDLSNIAQVMMALIYPFVWQHIFIPILPESLLSYCCAPMPFVVGVLEAHLPQVLQMPMDEVLIVMVDEDRFACTPDPDVDSDVKLLPAKYFTELLKNLKHARRLAKRAAGKKSIVKLSRPVNPVEMTQSIQILQASFLNFFVELLGPAYQLHFSEGKEYSVDGFKAVAPDDFVPLLDQFVCSQLFERFIRLYLLSDSNKNNLFEREIRLWLRKAKFNPEPGSKISFNYPTSCLSSSDPMGRARRATTTARIPAQSMMGRTSKQIMSSSVGNQVRPNSPKPQQVMPERKLPGTPAGRQLRSATTVEKPAYLVNSSSGKPNIPPPKPSPSNTPPTRSGVMLRSPKNYRPAYLGNSSTEWDIPTEAAPLPPGAAEKLPYMEAPAEDPPVTPSRDPNWMASLSKRTQKKRKKTISADFAESSRITH